MKYISYLSSCFNDNNCFKANAVYNRDGCLTHLIELRESCKKLGFLINTNDITNPKDSDLVLIENVFGSNPYKRFSELKTLCKPMILICSESPAVLKTNNDIRILKLFDSVFSYNDELLSSSKLKNINKFNYTFEFPKKVPRENFLNKKLLCLISANKRSKHSSELYSKRVEIIRWYEKNSPREFDLYGTGWENAKKAMAPWFRRKILQHGPWSNYFAPPFQSYKGIVDSKLQTLQNYKFSICFENVKDIGGYITEKIFDSMFAGCVPIYLGADNIQDYIPRECFINFRRFSSILQMHEYLTTMESGKYEEYLDAIDRFTKSELSVPFKHESFVDSMTKVIQKHLQI